MPRCMYTTVFVDMRGFFSDSFGSSGLVQEESLHNKFCAKAPRELQGLSEHEQKQKRKVQFSSKHHVHLCSAKQD